MYFFCIKYMNVKLMLNVKRKGLICIYYKYLFILCYIVELSNKGKLVNFYL